MPRLFEDRVDDAGEAYYACRECGLDLVLASDLISDEFRSGPHKALLFANVLNVDRGEEHPRDMTSGQHTIQSIFCKHCQTELGWTYVKAADACNRYKEGNFILVVPDIVSHPHRGGVVDADTAAAAAARKRRRSTSSAAAAAEGESAAAAGASSAAPPIPFATLSRSRYSTLGSRSGSLSSAGSGASSGTPPSGSQSSSRSRSSSSIVDDDEEADGGDASIPPDSTSALLSRLRALRRILGPPHSSASTAVHHTPPPLLPDPHLSPDSPQLQQPQRQQQPQQQPMSLGARLVRASQLAFIIGHQSPPPSV